MVFANLSVIKLKFITHRHTHTQTCNMDLKQLRREISHLNGWCKKKAFKVLRTIVHKQCAFMGVCVCVCGLGGARVGVSHLFLLDDFQIFCQLIGVWHSLLLWQWKQIPQVTEEAGGCLAPL